MNAQSQAKSKPQYQFRAMSIADLDAIMEIEPHIYSHPWTRGNFADSLKSEHSAWVLLHDKKIVGYALMMMVLDEAHPAIVIERPKAPARDMWADGRVSEGVDWKTA